jgi:hypothetical protein
MSTTTINPPATATTGRTRPIIVATALALGSLAVAILLLTTPGFPRDDFDYADVAAVRDGGWATTLVDGLGFAVAGVALALAVCMLARARGAVLANVGAVLVALGGLVFFAAEFAYGAFAWYATATAVLPAETGAKLIAYAHDNGGHLMGPLAAAFVAYNVGVLLLCVALWRARAVPRWLPIAIVVLTVAQFATPNSLAGVEESLAMLSFVPVGWYLVRGTR